MKTNLKKLVEEENEFWTQIFDNELKNSSEAYFSSYWWERYYEEIEKYFRNKLTEFKSPKVLEVGAGSGKASILLGKNVDRTLLDVSQKALDFAEQLVKKFDVNNITYVRDDMFKMPFPKNSFHLVWNIGVVEHYDFEDAVNALTEMIRVTRKKGYIAFAVPNFSSGPMLKAHLLKHPLLKFIPGYRAGTEKKYSEVDLIRMLNMATHSSNKYVVDFEIKYFGNPLPMETPKLVLKNVEKVTEKLFPKNKFLIFVIAKLDERKK